MNDLTGRHCVRWSQGIQANRHSRQTDMADRQTGRQAGRQAGRRPPNPRNIWTHVLSKTKKLILPLKDPERV